MSEDACGSSLLAVPFYVTHRHLKRTLLVASERGTGSGWVLVLANDLRYERRVLGIFHTDPETGVSLLLDTYFNVSSVPYLNIVM